jgi:hypothetical protein
LRQCLFLAILGNARARLTTVGLKIGVNADAPTQMLDVAGNILASGSLTASSVIVGSTNVITELTSLNTLTASHTTDIASNTSNILTKQETITTSTKLATNLLTTRNLEVNGEVHIDTTAYFDSIVIRRPTGVSGDATFSFLALREI